MNQEIARKVGGTILALVGLIFTLILIGAYWDDLDGFLRTGYVGTIIFSSMLISGLYILMDRKFQLHLRVIWTILSLPGMGLAMFFLLFAAYTGDFYVFIGTITAIVIFYAGLIITTLYGVYKDWLKSEDFT